MTLSQIYEKMRKILFVYSLKILAIMLYIVDIFTIL